MDVFFFIKCWDFSQNWQICHFSALTGAGLAIVENKELLAFSQDPTYVLQQTLAFLSALLFRPEHKRDSCFPN